MLERPWVTGTGTHHHHSIPHQSHAVLIGARGEAASEREHVDQSIGGIHRIEARRAYLAQHCHSDQRRKPEDRVLQLAGIAGTDIPADLLEVAFRHRHELDQREQRVPGFVNLEVASEPGLVAHLEPDGVAGAQPQRGSGRGLLTASGEGEQGEENETAGKDSNGEGRHKERAKRACTKRRPPHWTGRARRIGPNAPSLKALFLDRQPTGPMDSTAATRDPRTRMSGPLVLAHSYYLGYDEKQTRKMRPYPPLGTLITAALARSRGFDVHLFDAMLSSGVEAFEAMLDDLHPATVAILEDDFNFLTKMCTLRMRRAALRMIRAARLHGCLVAVNGSDASDHAELYLEAGADAVIIGEVESTFSELIETWRADPNAKLDGIAGLALMNVDSSADPGAGPARIHRTGVRPRLEELDSLPFPAWDLVDVERYRKAWTEAHGRLSWNMVTSRGCPYGCNWCAKPLFGRRFAQRSPANVAEELRLLRAEVRPDHIWFADDIFGLIPGWIEEFADEVTLRSARTAFTIQSRVNLMTPRTVVALEKAGSEEVWLGVESGSQRILDAMEKGTRVEEVREATRTLKAQGIRSNWFVQLGYLGEAWEDLLRTRDLIREERPDDIGVSVSYPLPGTPFYERVRKQLAAKRNWEHTDDLEMLFHGSYSTEFYRVVRDLLHDEVRSSAGSNVLDQRWSALQAEEDRYRNPVAVGVDLVPEMLAAGGARGVRSRRRTWRPFPFVRPYSTCSGTGSWPVTSQSSTPCMASSRA